MTTKKLKCIYRLRTSADDVTHMFTDKWLVTVTPSILIAVVRAISGRVGGRSVWIWRQGITQFYLHTLRFIRKRNESLAVFAFPAAAGTHLQTRRDGS